MDVNDIQRQLDIRFTTALVRSGEGNLGQQIAGAASFLEPVKSEPFVAEALQCMAKIPKNVDKKHASQALTDWNEAKKSLTKATQSHSSATLLIRALTKVKLPLSKAPEPVQELKSGITAVRVGGQYFVNWTGYLICFETSGPGEESSDFLSMIQTLEVNCPPPDGASGSGSHRGQRNFYSQKLAGQALVPIGLYLLFIAGPSFFGAWTGYNSSEEPQKGAASGAFLATVCGSCLSTAASVIAILTWGANAPKGSGVMTTGVAAFIFACLALVGGVIASGLLAAMASFGAAQGAKRGAFMAGIGAVLFPILLVAAIVAFQFAKS